MQRQACLTRGLGSSASGGPAAAAARRAAPLRTRAAAAARCRDRSRSVAVAAIQRWVASDADREMGRNFRRTVFSKEDWQHHRSITR